MGVHVRPKRAFTLARNTHEIATRDIPKGIAVDVEAVRELPSGWFFPYRSAGDQLFCGSQGVIINKQTGKTLRLGSAFPVERDLELYERGYQFETYDLVVLEIADLDVCFPRFGGQFSYAA